MVCFVDLIWLWDADSWAHGGSQFVKKDDLDFLLIEWKGCGFFYMKTDWECEMWPLDVNVWAQNPLLKALIQFPLVTDLNLFQPFFVTWCHSDILSIVGVWVRHAGWAQAAFVRGGGREIHQLLLRLVQPTTHHQLQTIGVCLSLWACTCMCLIPRLFGRGLHRSRERLLCVKRHTWLK